MFNLKIIPFKTIIHHKLNSLCLRLPPEPFSTRIFLPASSKPFPLPCRERSTTGRRERAAPARVRRKDFFIFFVPSSFFSFSFLLPSFSFLLSPFSFLLFTSFFLLSFIPPPPLNLIDKISYNTQIYPNQPLKILPLHLLYKKHPPQAVSACASGESRSLSSLSTYRPLIFLPPLSFPAPL